MPLCHLASESVPKGLGQQACESMSGYILIFNIKTKRSEVTLCDPRIANDIGLTEAMCLLCFLVTVQSSAGPSGVQKLCNLVFELI